MVQTEADRRVCARRRECRWLLLGAGLGPRTLADLSGGRRASLVCAACRTWTPSAAVPAQPAAPPSAAAPGTRFRSATRTILCAAARVTPAETRLKRRQSHSNFLVLVPPPPPGYWCVDEASCNGRLQNMPQEMSSNGWPESIEAGGIFSTARQQPRKPSLFSSPRVPTLRSLFYPRTRRTPPRTLGPAPLSSTSPTAAPTRGLAQRKPLDSSSRDRRSSRRRSKTRGRIKDLGRGRRFCSAGARPERAG